eukprot:gb/GFBE01046865.1/.p1 GENE.gb/GFBE01046865.1/~~gb/GFBE01046865.1/.p1  ORF type:complete len:326 (+),score=68.09 gb/GFBE01046865.1/:1-978(+)
MGIFNCIVCKKEYYDRRFIWENTADDAIQADGQILERCVDTDVGNIGISCKLPPARMTVVDVDSGSWAEQVGIQEFDELVAIDGKNITDMSSEEIYRRMRLRPVSLVFRRSDEVNSEALSPVDSLRQYADTIRASGTVANVTGSLAPALATSLAPVSAFGGVVGAAGGISQLTQGLSMPSGNVDTHLVAKGTVTTGVGATCAVLGAMATVVGAPLLIAAVGLGAAGLGAATVLDANMNGLCLECRMESREGGRAAVDAEEADEAKGKGNVDEEGAKTIPECDTQDLPDKVEAWARVSEADRAKRDNRRSLIAARRSATNEFLALS